MTDEEKREMVKPMTVHGKSWSAPKSMPSEQFDETLRRLEGFAC